MSAIVLLAGLSFPLGSPYQQEHAQACPCNQLPETGADYAEGNKQSAIQGCQHSRYKIHRNAARTC